MATLGDALDFIVGKKAADLLEATFAIRTVDDLLRHYPRKYSRGSTVLGEDDEPPAEGEHITFVDTISHADLRKMNRAPYREYLVVTLGIGGPRSPRRSSTPSTSSASW